MDTDQMHAAAAACTSAGPNSPVLSQICHANKDAEASAEWLMFSYQHCERALSS